MKTLIVGAGIAGNALAFWLSKLGHEVTVIEHFNTLRTTGLQIDLRGHGIQVLKRMGLEEAFRACMAPEEGLEIVDKSNRRWAFFPANRSGKGLQGFTTDYEIMRGDFCRMMHQATKDRVKYVFGRSVSSLEETDNAVDVGFTDGSADRFDLVVGADGQASRTRRLMLGPNAKDALLPLGGSYIGYYTIKRPIRDGERYVATSYMATRGRSVMVRRHSPTEMQVYLMCDTNSERLKRAHRGPVDEEKAALTEIFQDAGWKTDEFLKDLPGATNFYCEHLALVKMESWSRRRVALVGDAAYCPSAATGMGTTCGIVGAYILAGEIGRHCPRPGQGGGDAHQGSSGVLEALRAYEQKFRPFMDQVQKGISTDDGFAKGMPGTPFTIAVMNCLMGLASFLRVNVMGRFFLKEKVTGWDLPEYEEMV